MNEKTSDNVQIRQCFLEDFANVADLLCQLWPDKRLDRSALKAVYERALNSNAQAYVCAVEGACMVGFGSLTLKNNLWQEGYLGHVDELVVHSEHRRRGIGARLLEHLVWMARERGCRRVELDSACHRKEAHRFYERHGFENRAYLFSKLL
jgi:ribosomal protein S18 acetylase RimI-like enzyme